MNKSLSKILLLYLVLVITSALFFAISTKTVVAQQPTEEWWNVDWDSRIGVNLTETAGLARVNEPTDIEITFEPAKCRDPYKEVRVTYFDGSKWIEVPSQVYNVKMEGEYAKSCNVVFLANCPAYGIVTYYVYYNNPDASAPVYDGLRYYRVAKTVNVVNATKEGVEKKYFEMIWDTAFNLFIDGQNITLPGGGPGWEMFGSANFGTGWEDEEGNMWYGANKKVTVVNSGPVFVDLSLTMSYATDWWGKLYNYKVSTQDIVRVYYQPNLHPLVRYHLKIDYKEDAVTNHFWTVGLKFANDTSVMIGTTWYDRSYVIYKDINWKNTANVVQTNPVEISTYDKIWSPENPVGWWSYTGKHPSSTITTPKANIGLIPTYCGGTNPTYDYSVYFNASIIDLDNEVGMTLDGITGGLKDEKIETIQYIYTYDFTQPAEPTMSNTAKKLRNPLIYTLGAHDLTVSLEAPASLQTGESTFLNAIVSNRGLYNETNVELQLLIDGAVVNSTIISLLQVGSSYILRYPWTPPTLEATYNVTAYAVPVPAETNTYNNMETKFVPVVIDTTPPTISGIFPILAGQVIAPHSSLWGAEVYVNATVVDNILENIDRVFINYSIDDGATWKTVNMTRIAGTDVYEGTIPQIKGDATVLYKIIAIDKNRNLKEGPTYWYKTRAIPFVPMWFGLGAAIGAVITLIAALYTRKKS